RSHPMGSHAGSLSRVLCLYDNAGESFLPGADQSVTPVTRHLALAKVIFVLFDPTQDIRFHREMSRFARADSRHGMDAVPAGNVRQETLFVEAVARLRRYAGLGQHDPLTAKIVVVVTKYDVWAPLCPDLSKVPPQVWRYVPVSGTNTAPGRGATTTPEDGVPGRAVVRTNLLQSISSRVSAMLRRLSPEFVAAINGITNDAIYLPVSATGCNAVTDASGNQGFRPKDIRPRWAEAPMLYAIATQLDGFLAHTRKHQEERS
ncbi:MAG: hypothetical protein Q4C47_09425, partial [Planctomycetia bacterium]|nr:hypothetical protein [Planctomycetia bacterium]